MKKKTFAAIALTSCIALSATLTGCSLVSTNNRLDMEQVIATVDISKSDKFSAQDAPYTEALSSKKIIKRELVSYFLNVGYSYVQNGTSYKDTFNALVDALCNNAVLVQYSTVMLLEKADDTVSEYKQKTDEVEKYELLLNAVDEDAVNLAKYKLYSSINSAIDNYEKQVIEEEEGYEGTGTRTTPTNLDTEQDDFYPFVEEYGTKVLDYGIYTGYGKYTLEASKAYKDDALEGTTRSTRRKAYNRFLSNLRRNNLVDGDKEAEKLTDVLELDYIKIEYVSQLESRIINEYYDLYEDDKEGLLSEEYLQRAFEETFDAQKENYDNSSSAFDTAMSSMSSSSFILYSPETNDSTWVDDYGNDFAKYGFIYNILLPFSSSQTVKLNALKSQLTDDGDNDAYYAGRNDILKDIKTVDQRSVWFNGETDYSFKPSEVFKSEDNFKYFGQDDGREYLFFENNLANSGEDGRYEKLQAYDGRYSYNGKVYQNKDESYTLVPNKLDIDEMLDEFSAYVNYVMNDGEGNNNYVEVNKTAGYYQNTKFVKENTKDEIDYSLFTYATGKVKLDSFSRSDLMNPEKAQYKAMSAVNELQFAYTTDTSVLSNYIGYSVTAYDTSYIKEFEYAAKEAIGRGAGSFAVCAGDYGWHLIYVTYVFDAGETYTPDWSKKDVEGTFENLFYEVIKNNNLTDISSTRRTQILNEFNKDTTVTKFENRYQDLLDLDNN